MVEILAVLHLVLIFLLYVLSFLLWRRVKIEIHYTKVITACLGFGLLILLSILGSKWYVLGIVQLLLFLILLYFSYQYYSRSILRREIDLRGLLEHPGALEKEIRSKILLPLVKRMERKHIDLNKKLANVDRMKEELLKKIDTFKDEKLSFKNRKKQLEKQRAEVLKLQGQLHKERLHVQKIQAKLNPRLKEVSADEIVLKGHEEDLMVSEQLLTARSKKLDSDVEELQKKLNGFRAQFNAFARQKKELKKQGENLKDLDLTVQEKEAKFRKLEKKLEKEKAKEAPDKNTLHLFREELRTLQEEAFRKKGEYVHLKVELSKELKMFKKEHEQLEYQELLTNRSLKKAFRDKEQVEIEQKIFREKVQSVAKERLGVIQKEGGLEEETLILEKEQQKLKETAEKLQEKKEDVI